MIKPSRDSLFKDAVLDRLAESANVAQFVSFSPGEIPGLRFSRIRGRNANLSYATVRDAVEALLAVSPELKVNVRSFRPDDTQNHEFIYGLSSLDEAVHSVERLARAGFHTIVNET